MRNIQKLKMFDSSRVFVVVSFLGVLLLSLSGTMVLNSSTAYADPPNSVLATQKYCKSKLKKLQSVCTEKNMTSLRNAVDGQCKDEKGSEATACVAKAAEDVIDQVAKENPKNAKEFNNALQTALDKADKAAKAKEAAKAKKPACQGSECTSTPTGQGKNCDDTDCDLVALYVNPFINLLSIVVGIVVAGSLIMGGIQYAASSGDPQKTGAAKTRITNTLLAFVAYAFMYAFLNFLIPGGLFK